jgi:hypothetical protein
MRPQSAIQKGKDLENYICDQIRDKGLDLKAYRSHGSGNGTHEKADIWTSLTCLGRNVGIEAKNHATPHIKDWWLQTQKLEKLGREPILVYKLKGEGLGEAKAVVYLDTLLEIIKLANSSDNKEEVIKEDSYNIKQAKYKLTQAKELIRQTEKIINNEID